VNESDAELELKVALVEVEAWEVGAEVPVVSLLALALLEIEKLPPKGVALATGNKSIESSAALKRVVANITKRKLW
jgi:hypothetical protein